MASSMPQAKTQVMTLATPTPLLARSTPSALIPSCRGARFHRRVRAHAGLRCPHARPAGGHRPLPTHVTVVDAHKAPRPFQPIKVWADAPILALVEIDGVPTYISATTPATVQTDATGILTIVSDAADLSTTALQIWAGFMNPYERIVVYPDREFHNRLATTHYDNTSPSPDPTKINLATASTYTVTDLDRAAPLAPEQPPAPISPAPLPAPSTRREPRRPTGASHLPPPSASASISPPIMPAAGRRSTPRSPSPPPQT